MRVVFLSFSAFLSFIPVRARVYSVISWEVASAPRRIIRSSIYTYARFDGYEARRDVGRSFKDQAREEADPTRGRLSARPFVRTGIKPPLGRITQNSANACASGAYFAARRTRPIRYPVSSSNPPNLSIFFRTGHPGTPATDVKNQTDLRRVPPSRGPLESSSCSWNRHLSDEGNEGTDELSVDLSAATRWNFSCRRLHITALIPSFLGDPLFSTSHLPLPVIIPPLSLSLSLPLPRERLGSFIYFISKKNRDQRSHVSLNSSCARVTRLFLMFAAASVGGSRYRWLSGLSAARSRVRGHPASRDDRR